MVEVVFSLHEQSSDLHTLAPFVDRYGQDRYGDWPGKVTSDQQLKSDADDEQRRLATMPAPTDVDAYGGSKAPGWSEKGSGFYRVVRHGGFWWLITPHRAALLLHRRVQRPDPGAERHAGERSTIPFCRASPAGGSVCPRVERRPMG